MLRRSFFGLLASIPFVGKAFGDVSTPASTDMSIPIHKGHTLAQCFEEVFWNNRSGVERVSFGKAFLERRKVYGSKEMTHIRLPWKHTFNDGDFKQTVVTSLSRKDCVLLRDTLAEAVSRIDALDAGDDSKWQDNNSVNLEIWKTSHVGDFNFYLDD